MFEGENFCEFCGFVAIRESFLCEIWAWCDLVRHKQANRENCFFHQFAIKFSLSKVSSCTIIALLSIDLYSSSVHIARCTVYLK